MKRIDFEDFDQWCEQQSEFLQEHAFFDPAEHFEEEGVLFHEGDLTVQDLSVAPCVVVTGDLHVQGRITAEFECGLLVVAGSLHCREFTFRMDTIVGGDMHADRVQVDSGCDSALRVAGALYADSVIEDGHCIEVLGPIHSQHIESRLNLLSTQGVTVPRTGRPD